MERASYLMFKKSHIKYLFILFHLVGLIGFCIPKYHEVFKRMVPFHLLLMSILIILYDLENRKNILNKILIFFILGYSIEVIGVHTKIIFGTYFYGETLGIKIFDVPLIMGINWFILIFSIGDFCQNLKISTLFKTIVSALLMVIIDFFIEPVAQYFDYWHWTNEQIPMQNYIAWFIISFLFFGLYYQKPLKSQTPNGIVLYLCQLLFFVILGQILH